MWHLTQLQQHRDEELIDAVVPLLVRYRSTEVQELLRSASASSLSSDDGALPERPRSESENAV